MFIFNISLYCPLSITTNIIVLYFTEWNRKKVKHHALMGHH